MANLLSTQIVRFQIHWLGSELATID